MIVVLRISRPIVTCFSFLHYFTSSLKSPLGLYFCKRKILSKVSNFFTSLWTDNSCTNLSSFCIFLETHIINNTSYILTFETEKLFQKWFWPITGEGGEVYCNCERRRSSFKTIFLHPALCTSFKFCKIISLLNDQLMPLISEPFNSRCPTLRYFNF